MRKSNSLFWGMVFLLTGGVLLAHALGWLSDVAGWAVPLLLIWLGVWVLWQDESDRADFVSETGRLALPLRGSQRIRLSIENGLGSLQVSGGASSKLGLVLNYGGQLGTDAFHINGEMIINLDLGASVIPFMSPRDGVWRAALPAGVPLTLAVNAGVGSVQCDLRTLQVENLDLDVGLGRAEVICPQAGYLQGRIDLGAGNLRLLLPPEAAARIRLERGLASWQSEGLQWTQNGDIWQTEAFESAPVKVDLEISCGLGRLFIGRAAAAAADEVSYPAVDFSGNGNQADALVAQGLGEAVKTGGSHEEK